MYTTNPALLGKVKTGDDAAWFLFRDTYRPLIYHCARQMGLPADEYPRLEQDVLVEFFKVNGKFEYDPAKGRFRTYLGIIVRKCIIRYWNEKKKQDRNSELDENINLSEEEFELKWNKEWRNHIFWLAMKLAEAELSPKVVRVFELIELDGRSPAFVASSMKISIASVYNYRNRVLEFLRKNVDDLAGKENSK